MSETIEKVENPTWERLTDKQKENWKDAAILAFGVGDETTARLYFERMNKLNQKFSDMTEEEFAAYDKAEEEAAAQAVEKRLANITPWNQLTDTQKKFWENTSIIAVGAGGMTIAQMFYENFQAINAKFSVMTPEELKVYEQWYERINPKPVRTLTIEVGKFPLCACKGCQNKAQMRVKDTKKNLVFSICDEHAEQSDYEFVERVK